MLGHFLTGGPQLQHPHCVVTALPEEVNANAGATIRTSLVKLLSGTIKLSLGPRASPPAAPPSVPPTSIRD